MSRPMISPSPAYWTLEPDGSLSPYSAEFPTALLWGYSVFTSFRWPLPDVWLEKHWHRLNQNAKALSLQLPWSFIKIQGILSKHLEAEPIAVRLTVLPQSDSFTHLITQETLASRLILSTHALGPVSEDFLTVQVSPYPRAMAHLKHGHYVHEILRRREALALGAQDVLRLHPDGCLYEGSTSNLFIIEKAPNSNRLLLTTPPVNSLKSLPGITQMILADWIVKAGESISWEPISLGRLAQADGAFLTNSTSGLQSIGQWIDPAGQPHVIPWSAESRQWVSTTRERYLQGRS